jgi:hypothetical protein
MSVLTLVVVSYSFSGGWLSAVAGGVVPGLSDPTARGDTLPGKPSVEIACDQAQRKSVKAMVRFRLHKADLSETRVDFTDAENGFETGRFVSLMVTKNGSRLVRRDGRVLRAELEGAAITGNGVVVRIKNLEPGINYVWRVMERGQQQLVASEFTRTSAIACQ